MGLAETVKLNFFENKFPKEENMFGLLDKVVDGVCDTVEEFVDDPVGKTIDVVTQPVRDGLEVVSGLTEGELRLKAATRLGADVASGMALGELIEWYSDLD